MTGEIGRTNWPPPGFLPGLGILGETQLKAATRMQQAFVEVTEDLNRAWLARLNSQVNFASEMAGKLATARTAPDVATTYEQCIRRQFEMLAEDSRRMLADTEKLVQAAAQGLPESPLDPSS